MFKKVIFCLILNIPKYCDNVMSTINVLDELIQIRDGQVSCDAIDFVDCEEMILDICIN